MRAQTWGFMQFLLTCQGGNTRIPTRSPRVHTGIPPRSLRENTDPTQIPQCTQEISWTLELQLQRPDTCSASGSKPSSILSLLRTSGPFPRIISESLKDPELTCRTIMGGGCLTPLQCPTEDTPVGVGLAFPRGLQVDRVNVIPKKKKRRQYAEMSHYQQETWTSNMV